MPDRRDAITDYSDVAPGPCYPNYPDLRRAYAVHRRDPVTNACRYCGAEWDV